MSKTASPPKKVSPLTDGNNSADDVRRYCVMHARLLIALREHLGLTHQEVAERTGLPLSTVRNHEAAGPRAKFFDQLFICEALGFDYISICFEVDRRLIAEGVNVWPKKPDSLATFVRKRCAGRKHITPAEVRRQLRLMASLTLPAQPAPTRKRSAPAKKRSTKKTSRKAPSRRK